MGWCLHNIDYRLLEDWIEFSKNSDKFVEGECDKEWCDMDMKGLGLVHYLWAKEDNTSNLIFPSMKILEMYVRFIKFGTK